MSDALIARCRELLKFDGGRETAKDWPVSISRADLMALLERLERKSAPTQAWPLSLRAEHALDRALHPVDFLDV